MMRIEADEREFFVLNLLNPRPISDSTAKSIKKPQISQISTDFLSCGSLRPPRLRGELAPFAADSSLPFQEAQGEQAEQANGGVVGGVGD
jgi:hypothetical protein